MPSICDLSSFLAGVAYNDCAGLDEVMAASAVACCELCAVHGGRGGAGVQVVLLAPRCFLKADDTDPVKRAAEVTTVLAVTDASPPHHRIQYDNWAGQVQEFKDDHVQRPVLFAMIGKRTGSAAKKGQTTYKSFQVSPVSSDIGSRKER